jgi:hypothetical protein
MNKDIYLIVFAPVYGPSGYAKLSRRFVLGLDKLGIKIKLIPNKLWEPHKAILSHDEEKRLNDLEKTIIPNNYNPIKLNIGIAPWFDKEYKGYKIGYTMFEFSNIPEVGKYNWKSSCLAMNEIWVPSQYNYNTFTNNGINNVIVMPPGIDTEEYCPNKLPLIDRNDKKFRFLALGEYTTRKGWDLLIPAYLDEFNKNDNVTLIIKSYNGSKGIEDSKRIIKEDITKYRDKSINNSYPNILFIGDILSSDRLPNLYNSIDAFILLTRGEGFGFPMAEAMSCCKPCIVPNNSSYLDFVNDSNGYLINIKGIEKFESLYKSSLLYKDSESPIIDIKHTKQLMRYVYNNREELHNKGLKARKDIVDNYTEDQAALRMFNRLKELDINSNTKINIITDNLNELLIEDTKIKDSIMVIPTWEENCGIADYTKRLVDNLKKNQNVFIVKNIYDLINIVNTQNIKLVHIQHHYSFYNCKKLIDIITELKSIDCKVILTIHDYACGIKSQNECFKYCDRIIVHSDLIKEQIINDNIIENNKVDVILMGADLPYYFKKEDAQKECGLQNKKVIASFGFLQPHKNWIEVIKAIDIIKRDIPNIIYLLMSVSRKDNIVAEKYKNVLDSTILRLGLSDNIKYFNSYLSEEKVLRMLSASDAIVLPYSNYKINNVEYYGVSIASRFAMRVRRPLLISNASFFSDLKSISYNIEPNAQSIANGLKDIFNNKELEKKILLKQYNFSIVNSWNKFKEKTLEVYKNV